MVTREGLEGIVGNALLLPDSRQECHMKMYLLRNGSLALDLKRRSHGCLYVQRADLGTACWIPPSMIRSTLKTRQAYQLARTTDIPLLAAG